MFARNYLGVHTPQDVLVGCVASLVLMAAIVPLYRRMQAGNAKQDNIILLAGLLLVAVSALYITLKPYPMDYVNGVLLVDPEKMKPDSIGGIGSSKSTLVQLIPRLYDVTEGSVKVGGVDVREYDLDALRSAVPLCAYLCTKSYIGVFINIPRNTNPKYY